MKWPTAMIVCTIHDELEIEVSPKEADAVAAMVEEKMLEAAYFYIKDTPMKVDVTIANCWVK